MDQSTERMRGLSRPFRGALQRGESLVATAGLLAAAILIVALGAAAWWSVRSHSEATRSAREGRVRAVAQLLARNAGTILAGEQVVGAQHLVEDAARTHGFAACRIVVPALDGQVVADALRSGGIVDRLPEKWGSGAGAPLAAEAAESIVRRPDGILVVRAPVPVPGRGLAELHIEDHAASAAGDSWQVQSGIGVIGALAMLALWLAYRAMRRRLRALGAIGEALKSADLAESAGSDLLVSPDLGPEAAAWNRLVADRDRLRESVATIRAAEKLSGRKNRDGDLGSVCDGLWLGLLLVDEQLRIKYVNGAASVFLRGRREELLNADLRRTIDDQKVLDAIRGVAAGTVRNRVISEIRRLGDPEPGGAGRGSGAVGAAPAGADAHAGAGAAGAGLGVAGAPVSVLRFTVRPLRKEDSAIALVVIEDVTQQRVADESRNSFVAQATHELRTPLTNIRLYVEMLLESGGADDPKKRADALNVINQESRRLERIVGDMLSVSEIEAGSMKLNRDDVRIRTIFEEVEADFREQAAAKQIRLRVDLPPKLPLIMGDRDKIVMALHNLVGNAVKYTPSGGEVVVRVGEEKGNLIVDVTDNGIGIREDEKDLIFEKFYRAKDRRIANITGTGLGLAIAREVIRLHGGDITVRSQLDKGSTFTMALPAAA